MVPGQILSLLDRVALGLGRSELEQVDVRVRVKVANRWTDRRARGATAASARSAKRRHCTGGPLSEPRPLSWKLSASNFSFSVLFLESNLQNAMIEHSPSSSPPFEASPGEMRLPPEGFRRSLSSSWIKISKIAPKQTETLHEGRASSSPICGFHR
ncbi:hypothetical protein V6N11_012661 [Hibiscus sabdariffa]|uniref:Uncharacterized protein n=1 Tax=Hibiscus sabdariffa TaxID=183260 RepID=A0ABR2QC89_9ROSI